MYAELDAMKNRIIDSLTVELGGEPTFNADLLAAKVEAALIEIQSIRRYPSTYTLDMIEADMENFFPNIRAVALYDYSQIGIEYQDSSSENGISRKFVDRNSLLYGVRPLAGLS